MHPRSSLLDFLRGLLLLGMIIYHTSFDLQMYWGFAIETGSGLWKIFARIVAIGFLIISGMAMELSEEHLRTKEPADRWKRRLRRAALTGSAALAVTIVTYAIDEDTYVHFGILHLIAVARLLVPLVMPLPATVIAILSACIFGASLSQPWHGASTLLPLGVMPASFTSVDYFPLIPWIAAILLGIALMRMQWMKRWIDMPMQTDSPPLLSFCGKHSLFVYLIHQPLIIFVLTLFLGWPNW